MIKIFLTSFDYFIKIPTTSFFFKKLLNISTGSQKPKRNWIGILSVQQLYEIALLKKLQFSYKHSLYNICKMLISSALSIGIWIQL